MISEPIGIRAGRPALRGVLLGALTLAVAALGIAAAGETPPEPSPAPTVESGNEPPSMLPAPGPQPRERSGRDRRRSFRREPARGARAPFDLLRSARRMAAALDLSEEQQDRLRAVAREIGDDRRDARRRIADARRDLHRAARNPDSAGAELQELGAALGRAQADALLVRRSSQDRSWRS